MPRTWLDLAAGPNGWVEATIGETPESFRNVYVRFSRAADGRWSPTGELRVVGLTPESLRAVPLQRILLALEASEPLRNDLAKRLDQPGDWRDFEERAAWVQEELPPLKRPARRNLPDSFYAEVATRYRDAVRRGLRPRPVIAEGAGVSGEVAGRWIREARRRGFLPPTTPGKVRA